MAGIPRKKVGNGLFVTFEGPEGAGKSTQMRMLGEVLMADGYEVLATREPGGTHLGEELRHLVKHLAGDEAPCPVAELLLMGAGRAQHVEKVIAPFLAAGGIVLCDRFADSTTVYQGVGRGLDMDFVMAMHRQSTGGCWPRLTILLDVPCEIGLGRSRQRCYGEGVRDRFEDESLHFHRTVRDGFLELAAAEPQRFRIFSTELEIAEVHAGIVKEVRRVLDF